MHSLVHRELGMAVAAACLRRAIGIGVAAAVACAAPAVAAPARPGTTDRLSPQLAFSDLHSASAQARAAGGVVQADGDVVVQVRADKVTEDLVRGLRQAGAGILDSSRQLGVVTAAAA